MNKIVVTIYVLTLDYQYDLLLPINIVVREALELIQNSIVDLFGEDYVINENAVLYNENGDLINLNNIVKFSGIKNGSKLMLV